MRVRGHILGLVLLLAASLAVAQSAEDLLQAGRADEAITLLKKRVAAVPRDAAAHNLLSRAYFQLQRWDDSVSAGEKAVAYDPGNSRYHLWLGRAYGEKADHSIFFKAIPLAKKTRAEFEKAVQLQNTDLDAQ